MKHLLLLTVVLSLASCAHTGDPSDGGLFGWSSSMYQDDMNARQQHLNAIKQDTQHQRSEAAHVQRQIDGQRAE